MKKIYMLFVATMFVTFLSAQQLKPTVVAPPMTKSPEVATILDRAPESPFFSERGGSSLLFFEDFANGLEGNNGFGSFIADDNTGEGIWSVQTTDGSQGEWNAGTDPLGSETQENGWMLFDADLYNTQFAGSIEGEVDGEEAYQDVEGTLTAPELDMSTVGAVLVTWTQYYRYCCDDDHPIRLEVSNDGGDTWEIFQAGGIQPSETNVLFGPQDVTVDISCVAGNEESVLIRWAWRQDDSGGNSHYFWGIDDITIAENETGNDMLIGDYVSYTNYNQTGIYEAGVWPISQLTSLEAAANYQVLGTIAQPNASLTVTAGSVSASTDPVTLEYPTCVGDTLVVAYTPEAVVGPVTVEYNLASDSTDATPDNNLRTQAFEITEFSYGRDDGTFTGTFPPDGSVEYIAAAMYQAFDEMTVYGIDVAIMNGADGGTDIVAYIMDNGLEIIEQTDEIEVNPEFLNSTNTTDIQWHTLLFEDPVTLPVNGLYGAGFNHFGGSDVQIGESKTVPAQTCFVNGDFGTAGFDWYYTTSAPMVRFNLDPNAVQTPVSTVDLEDFDGNKLFQNSPNPATDQTGVRFKLVEAAKVQLDVRDMTGRLIETRVLGTLGQGVHTEYLNTQTYEAGMYTYSVNINGQRLTQTMIVSGK